MPLSLKRINKSEADEMRIIKRNRGVRGCVFLCEEEWKGALLCAGRSMSE